MQVSSRLRKYAGGYMHWCPACEEMHPLPDGWKFDGNLEKPTFHPSFRHTGFQTEKLNGEWTGEWVRGADGKPLPWVCHYHLTAGGIQYCPDCTHALAGKLVPLPVLPEHLRD